MRFYYPLGLLGLIGIPIIIIIYIIKSKYTEQTVGSTYLWELSEKFLKKRKPISKLTGIITLILQILAVLFVSVAVAHPVFTVRASAEDVFIILDGSASMNMRQGDSTRFDIAKQRVDTIIDEAHGGSTFTLVFVSDTVDTVFEGVSDKEQAKIFVQTLSAGWTASDCASALVSAQEYYDADRSAVMYLVTDKAYEVNDALTLIDVAGGESNFAFCDIADDTAATGVRRSGKVVSYSDDATVTVELLYAKNSGDALVKADEVRLELKKSEPCEFELESDELMFAELELRIVGDDDMSEDNRIVWYNVEKRNRTALIVSDLSDENDDAAYLRSAIRYAGNADVDVVDPETYARQGAQGYGMYVFNGYKPETLPSQAAVWLIDAIDGSDKTTRVGYRDHAVPRDATGPDSYYSPQYAEPSNARETELTRDIVRDGRELAVRKYAQYTVPRGFMPILEEGGDSLVFAGLNDNNDRQVVFAFRIKDSDFGMSDNFLILIRNLMDYSFPSVLSQTSYVCGDTMTVHVVPNCENIVVTTPSGKTSTLDTVDADACEVALNETGVFMLTVKVKDSAEFRLFAYSRVPETESRTQDVGGAMLLSGEREYEYSDGFYDSLLIFFIVIALVVLADWGVYCYEQYQLR